MSRKKPLIGYALLCSVLVLAGCGSSHHDEPDPLIPGTYTYNFTLSSTANLPDLAIAIMVSAPMLSQCAAFAGPFTQDGQSTAASGGTQSVTFNITKLRSTYF